MYPNSDGGSVTSTEPLVVAPLGTVDPPSRTGSSVVFAPSAPSSQSEKKNVESRVGGTSTILTSVSRGGDGSPTTLADALAEHLLAERVGQRRLVVDGHGPGELLWQRGAKVSVALPDRLTGPDCQVIGAVTKSPRATSLLPSVIAVSASGCVDVVTSVISAVGLPARLSCTAFEAVAVVVIGMASPVSGSRYVAVAMSDTVVVPVGAVPECSSTFTLVDSAGTPDHRTGRAIDLGPVGADHVLDHDVEPTAGRVRREHLRGPGDIARHRRAGPADRRDERMSSASSTQVSTAVVDATLLLLTDHR